jgi:two-component system C4-dicarboxylate transport response regulator DctD
MSAGQVSVEVVLVDDEPMVRESTLQWLEVCGYKVSPFGEAKTALEHLKGLYESQSIAIVVTDVRMPEMDGLALLDTVLRDMPGIPVVLLTGHGDVDMAIKAMRDGAYDFIEKPYVPERLTETVQRAGDKRRLILENARLQAALTQQGGLDTQIIGISPSIQRLRKDLLKLASLDTNVIVYGETGTGKELIAQCLHQQSLRHAAHFVPINCGAIPESLMESELFGHEAGAFTSAAKKRIGKFEYADKGTLFLDEIESMPPPLQVRMLRALQEGVVERLGSNESIPVDVRVIAASKVDLRLDESFREDLFYRLNVSQLYIPPLRERMEDVPLLFSHYVRLASNKSGGDDKPRPVSDHDLLALASHPWPGNVRELKNVAIRFALDTELSVASILSATDPAHLSAKPRAVQTALPLSVQVAEFESGIIRETLKRHQGNIKAVMEELDLPRRTLNQKMVRYGLNRGDFVEE